MPEDPRSYYQVAQRIARETPNSFYANQYHNPANPEAHYLSTRPRDLGADAAASFDVFVRRHGHRRHAQRHRASSSSEKKPDIQIVGVDPVGSLYYDFVKTRPRHQALLVQGRRHRRGLLPDDDEPQDPRRRRPRRRQGVLPHDARSHAPRGPLRRRLGRRRGGRRGQVRARMVEQGADSGRRPARILVFLADAGHKYVSKIFNDDWMRENGFLEDAAGHRHRARRAGRPREASARGHRVADATLRDVIAQMKAHGDQPAPRRRRRQAARHRRRGRPLACHRLRRQDARLADRRARRGRLRDGDAEHEDRASAGRARRREGRHRRGRATRSSAS